MIPGGSCNILAERSITMDVFRVQFRYSSGNYQVNAQIRNDSTGYGSTTRYNVSDAPHTIRGVRSMAGLSLDWER